MIAIFFAGGISEAQIKQRTQNRVFYTGVGYKFVLFTDSEARSAYPFFDITDQAFVKELGGFFGMVLSERVAFELAPSYIFSNEYGSDDSEADGGGFYFKESEWKDIMCRLMQKCLQFLSTRVSNIFRLPKIIAQLSIFFTSVREQVRFI
ncbi:MAG: hypothetical protein IPG99_18320 [Ignavibacteria bacterium]|nr:hypothetical protein [Ignavibacteria bacterium]